jgi:hypothetical protein
VNLRRPDANQSTAAARGEYPEVDVSLRRWQRIMRRATRTAPSRARSDAPRRLRGARAQTRPPRVPNGSAHSQSGHGRDTLLPRAGALGWTRAWQARRYSTGTVAWKRCEEALDVAVAAYAIEHYTFVFAHDLSHTGVKAFDKRLTTRHHGVTVDYWGVSELLARLDETREGRRVARSFFGPPQDEIDQQWREAVALGGELRNANDVLGRLRAMGSWLERRDAYAYETHTWETDQPAWRITPGTVMSQRDVDENGTRRIDARLRDAGRDDIRPPEIRIDFTPDEAGQRAMQALARADASQSSARLTEGFTVTFEHLPELWADDEGVVQTPDELHLDPIQPPRKPRRFVLKIQTGEAPVVLDAAFEPCDLDDWRTAWRGQVGGLQITFAVRQPSAERAEGYLHFAYKLLDGASARTEHEAVNALLALQRPGTVTVADPRFPEADIRFSLRGGERDEQLHALAIILDAVVTIEDYTAERLPLPPAIDREQGNLIVQTAHLMRTEAFAGQIDDEYVMPATDDLLAGLNAGAPFMVQAEKGIELFGRTVWLGFLEYVIRDYATSSPTRRAPDACSCDPATRTCCTSAVGYDPASSPKRASPLGCSARPWRPHDATSPPLRSSQGGPFRRHASQAARGRDGCWRPAPPRQRRGGVSQPCR